MRADLSLAMLISVYNQTSDEAIILLLTLSKPDLPPEDTLYFALNGEDIVSRGITFLSFPFDVIIPDDTSERPPQATVVVSNVDRRMTEFLERSSTPISANIEVILGSTPDTIEASWAGMTLRNVKYNVQQIQGTLTFEAMTNEGYPKGTFSPSYFPGMF